MLMECRFAGMRQMPQNKRRNNEKNVEKYTEFRECELLCYMENDFCCFRFVWLHLFCTTSERKLRKKDGINTARKMWLHGTNEVIHTKQHQLNFSTNSSYL